MFVLNEMINFIDDYCRVLLSGNEEEDYINASFMDVSPVPFFKSRL